MNTIEDDERFQQIPAVLAMVDLANRAGALSLDIGYEPTEPPRWYAEARYKTFNIVVRGCRDPEQAALRMARKLLNGGMCRCGLTGTTDPVKGRRSDCCLWRLTGSTWEPSCDATPAPAPGGTRGSIADMKGALVRHLNREGPASHE